MTKPKFDRNIPIPTTKRGTTVWAWMKEMKKGDSKLVTTHKIEAVRQAAQTYIGKGKYAVRMEGKHPRVWKTG